MGPNISFRNTGLTKIQSLLQLEEFMISYHIGLMWSGLRLPLKHISATLSLTLLCSNLTGLLAGPWTEQAGSHLRIFALAIPSAWTTPLLGLLRLSTVSLHSAFCSYVSNLERFPWPSNKYHLILSSISSPII